MSYLAVEVTLAEALENEQDGYLCVFTTGHMQFRLGKNLEEYEYYGDDYDKLLRLYPFMVDGMRNPALEWIYRHSEECWVQRKFNSVTCTTYSLPEPCSGSWVAVGVKETRVNATPCPECGGADAEGCCTWVTSE